MSEKNYKMLIAYDGSRYYGWEHQPDKPTIQGKIEDVLKVMCGREVEVIGAGRTDAGVHARAMTANVRMDTKMTEEEILKYMNHYLPEDISIREIREASERFHARYKAVGKLYTYTCWIGEEKPVFERKYVYIPEGRPDTEKMQEAAACLTGEHDFKAFCGNPKYKKSTIREVDRIEIKETKDKLYLNFHGTGFLQNMVRILTGTLLEVGFGRMSVEDVRNALNKKDRQYAGPTAPAKGLCLMKVDY